MEQNSISNALQASNRHDCLHVAATEKVGIEEGGELRWQEDARYTTGIFADDRFKPKELAVAVQESDFFKVIVVYIRPQGKELSVRSILSRLPYCITAVLGLLVIDTIFLYFCFFDCLSISFLFGVDFVGFYGPWCLYFICHWGYWPAPAATYISSKMEKQIVYF